MCLDKVCLLASLLKKEKELVALALWMIEKSCQMIKLASLLSFSAEGNRKCS